MLRNAFAGIVVVLSMAPLAAESRGQTVYNDGGTHTINGPSGPIEVLNGSTVNLDSQALVTGGFATSPLGYIASVFGDASSTINLNGGQVMARQTSGSPSGNLSGAGIITSGLFTATGGTVEGGVGSSGQIGGWGLNSTGSLQISGGAFIGGDGTYGGTAVAVGGVNNSVTISGGTFQGGNGTNIGGGGAALTLGLVAGMGEAQITGGDFLAGTGGYQGVSLLYQAQYQTPGSSEVDISGGIFSGPIQFALYKTQDSMNFFGQGFQLQNMGGTEWFSGTLADGTPIDVQLYANSAYHVEVASLPVGAEFSFLGGVAPEPSSLLTYSLGIGMVLLASISRRKKKRPGPRGLTGR